MLKKMIAIFVVLSFISVSIFAGSDISINKKIKSKKKLVNKVYPLNDSELKLTEGKGLWDCIGAIAAWIGACIAISESLWASLGLVSAYLNMKDKCNVLKW